MRAGGEIRGNSHDRKARKLKLLRVYGNGQTAPCIHCTIPVDYSTMEVDKIIPGSQGGRYVWANIHVSCFGCNRSRSDNTTPVEIANLQRLVIL